MLFPANTQVAVFVSMDVGEFFALDSVTMKVDNKEVANYLYTQREAEALLKGGVHRVYIGNLKAGDHELIALFTGQGPNAARLSSWRHGQARKRRRCEIRRAQDQRSRCTRAARVHREGMGVIESTRLHPVITADQLTSRHDRIDQIEIVSHSGSPSAPR